MRRSSRGRRRGSWIFGESLANLLSGPATGPYSAPLVILLGAGVWGLDLPPAPRCWLQRLLFPLAVS